MTELSQTLEKLYKEYCACEDAVVRMKTELKGGIGAAVQRWEQKEQEFEKSFKHLSNYLGVADFADVRFELLRCMRERDVNGAAAICDDAAPFNGGMLALASADPIMRVVEVKKQIRGTLEQWAYEKASYDKEISDLKAKNNENIATQEIKTKSRKAFKLFDIHLFL